MVSRENLGDIAGVGVLEYDEMAHQIEEAPLLEHARHEDLKLRGCVWRKLAAVNCPPSHEAFVIGRQRSDPGFKTVRNDERLIEHEERTNLVLVRLKLFKRRPHRCVLISRIFKLDDCQRKAVDE